jgi:Type I phosphodiesterase / nucleotide pyrophosphatase
MTAPRTPARRRVAARVTGLALVLLALPVLAGGTGIAAVAQTSAADPAMVKSVCQIPTRQLLRIWHGTRSDWGVDIVLQAKYPNFVSGGLSHSGPWPYLQHVPIFFYGPGIVPARGSVSRPVLSTDIAPTEAALLDFPQFHAPDGKVMPEALPDGGVTTVPKLLVTFVWDAAGLDVLDTWPKSWPYLKSLIPKGVWFSRATIGSSPSNTPPIHATIGTGAFPMHSGILDEFQRVNGQMQKPQQDGPAFELVPTLADLYDRDNGNKPLVGEIATLSAHMGMIGHGSMWGGGDRDIAVTREHLFAATGGAEGNTWDLTPGEAPFFRMPAYVNAVPGLKEAVHQVDQSDGKLDGMWMHNSIEQLANGFDTPARTIYQAKVTDAILQREGFGSDATPDLFFINDKSVDTIGHAFSVNSREVEDAVQVEDQNLQKFVAYLNHLVGKGQWAMVVTADHGHQFDPSVSGAFEIYVNSVVKLLNARFSPPGGPNVVQKMRPSGIWLDHDALEKAGYTIDDVATYVSHLTEAQTVRPNGTIQPGQANAPVFEAAFPSSILSSLPCLPQAHGASAGA